MASRIESRRRFTHSLVAFLAALLLPVAALAAWHLLSAGATAVQTASVMSNAVLGGIIAAVAVYRHRRMPL